jgi:hypothetical protein
MDHHEQRHEHHHKEREKRIEHQKVLENQEEQISGRIHPAWFIVLGVVLILLIVLSWIFLL